MTLKIALFVAATTTLAACGGAESELSEVDSALGADTDACVTRPPDRVTRYMSAVGGDVTASVTDGTGFDTRAGCTGYVWEIRGANYAPSGIRVAGTAAGATTQSVCEQWMWVDSQIFGKYDGHWYLLQSGRDMGSWGNACEAPTIRYSNSAFSDYRIVARAGVIFQAAPLTMVFGQAERQR